MLTLENVSIFHLKDLRPLISGLSLTLSGDERIAIIGEEGNGKSTLLKSIACPDALEGYATVEGNIQITHEHIAYLSQDVHQTRDTLSVYDYCTSHEAFLDMDWKDMDDLCRKLHLSPDLPYAQQAMRDLSGGEKVRLALLLCMCERPTMLLLDEPGNDLDLDAMQILEHFLLTCHLPVLYVSHDETLLSRTATAILHLESLHGREAPRWTFQHLSYDAYMRQRRNLLERQEQQFQNDQRQARIRQEKFQRIQQAVEHAQNAVSRQDPHGGQLLKKKMKAVKSLEHRYARESEQMTERPYEEYAMNLTWDGVHALPGTKEVLHLSLAPLVVEGHTLCESVNLHMRGNDKVLIIGPNGSGKTTLFNAILQDPATTMGLRAGIMRQQYADALPDDISPIEYLNPGGEKERLTRVRLSLGAMKMTRDEMTHPMQALSGGQRAKVLWLSLVLGQPELLLLDEPTRNLSPLSSPIVRDLILSFPGPVLCITHDRILMREWPGSILRLTPQGLKACDRNDLP